MNFSPLPPLQAATLPCGLRLILAPSTSDVVHCGYIVMAGTRHEAPADAGLAHFIEHMSFKGTARRRACHISNGLERVGGDLNAFTNKQETVYQATVLRPDFDRAADLLTDIVFHSTYPQHEMDREAEVVCDEIDSYKDSPADLIFDEFEAMVFAGHPLGRDILGNAERLRAYRTEDALRFARQWYRPDNAVFYVSGRLDFGRVCRRMERLTAGLEAERPAPPADGLPQQPPLPAYPAAEQERTVHRDTHQAHVLIGARAYGGRDARRYGLILLNNILGGPGMNSRLNLRLREKAGLVYSVDAYLATYPDTGLWNVYFGCDAADVARCRRLVLAELRRLVERPLSPAQLAAAQKQLCGQIGIGCENAESYALAVGRTYAHYGEFYDPQGLCDRIRSLTPDALRAAAAEAYAPGRLTTLIYR